MNTQVKIEEARFFVSKMREKYNDRTEFKFYLSAFLSAGRGITWVMKAEFIKVPFYETWHNNRKLSEEEARVFKRINELRVETNKIKPIHTRPIVSTIIEIPVNLDYQKYLNQQFVVNISAPDEDGSQTLSFVDKTTGETFYGQISDYRIVKELGDEDDLLEICENYLSFIEGIYSEWIAVLNEYLSKSDESGN